MTKNTSKIASEPKGDPALEFKDDLLPTGVIERGGNLTRSLKNAVKVASSS